MRILIIDDEGLARDILKKQLNLLHYEQVYLAESGEKALEIMQLERPDLIFLDICMPEMSGIELMERAALWGNDWIYVITSSYDLFEYAQRVMELGAFKYLLKPIEDSKLEQALQAAERKLKQRKLADNRLFQLNQDAVRSQDLLQRKYLYEVLNGLESGQPGHNTFPNPRFQVCLFHLYATKGIGQEPDEMGLLQFGVENIMKEILMQHQIVAYFFEEGACNGVLCNYQEMADTQKCFPGWQGLYQSIFKECQSFVKDLYPCEVTFGIGKETEGPDKLPEAFHSAQEALHQKLVKGNGAVYYAREYGEFQELQASNGTLPGEESQSSDSRSNHSPNRQIERVINSIYTEEEYTVEQAIEMLYGCYIYNRQIDYKKLNKMHLNLFVLLHKELERKAIDSTGVLEDEFLLYRRIQTLESIQAMKEFLIQIITRCQEAIQRTNSSGNAKIMQRAKRFIQENIGGNLTLESAAESVQLSPVYFSKLFKSEVGITFIEYATKTRIEEAKKLLRQNRKAADICEQIGFQDVKHFYKVFKKYEGMTPGDYKKRG